MPAIYRTILPRLKRSIGSHGVWGTVLLLGNAPFRLWREYKDAKRLSSTRKPDPFDLEHGIETSQTVHASDLRVSSRNWIDGVDYQPTPVKLIREALAALPVNAAEFTFIDFGCGKGRVLFVASEFPFARIIGVEYAPQLHEIACRNIQRYRGQTQECSRIEAICQDMTTFHFPEGPLVLFFYNPASESVMRTMAAKITPLSQACWVVYVNPSYKVFESLNKVRETDTYAIYTGAAASKSD
jgi:SAM-dependent methyltransferase